MVLLCLAVVMMLCASFCSTARTHRRVAAGQEVPHVMVLRGVRFVCSVVMNEGCCCLQGGISPSLALLLRLNRGTGRNAGGGDFEGAYIPLRRFLLHLADFCI